MSDKPPIIYIANETGVTEIGGVAYTFAAGVTRVRAGHPLLKACPKYFEPVSDDVTWVNGKRIRAL
jgi:hypothetical protein